MIMVNSDLERQVKKYLKEIKKGVSDYGANGEEIVKDLETNISYFVARFPNASFSDIEEEFGTASNIIEGFYSADELSRSRRSRDIMKIALICGAVVAVIIIIWFW